MLFVCLFLLEQQQHYVQGQPAALPYNYILSPTAPQQNQLEYIYPGNAASPNAAASMNSQHVQGNVTTTIPTHSSTPYLIPAVASRKKESVVVRVDDSTEMIRIQAQRIARLEERCDLLTKQYQRYITSLEYKDQEINHWQERCNIMQSHLGKSNEELVTSFSKAYLVSPNRNTLQENRGVTDREERSKA